VVGKDIICLQATQNNTLYICRKRPPPLCTNQHLKNSIRLIFVCFCSISSNVAIEKNQYFTLSFIFLSPGDVSITAIAAPIAKRWTHPPDCCRPQPHVSLLSRSKMPLPPLMPRALFFGHGNPSSSCHPLLPPLPAVVLSLLLLSATACLYRPNRWLVVVSFPALLSAACSVVRRSHH
jgi:hypothetical protein